MDFFLLRPFLRLSLSEGKDFPPFITTSLLQSRKYCIPVGKLFPNGSRWLGRIGTPANRKYVLELGTSELGISGIWRGRLALGATSVRVKIFEYSEPRTFNRSRYEVITTVLVITKGYEPGGWRKQNLLNKTIFPQIN